MLRLRSPFVLALLLCACLPGSALPIWKVSVATDGTAGNSYSCDAMVTPDGRYVAFSSFASNLVAGDTNTRADVFVHDRLTGVTERVSVDSGGGQTDGNSWARGISADGRYVAFESLGTTLVAGDTNGRCDVFVHDRTSGVTERVSVTSAEEQGDDDCYGACMSADGRCVAFHSSAAFSAADTNGGDDVYLRDRTAGTTEQVSVSSNGTPGDYSSRYPTISADGRYVAFISSAHLVPDGTLEQLYVRDRTAGTTLPFTPAAANGWMDQPAISGNGRYVAFHSSASNLVAGDTNGLVDVFVVDRTSGTISRVSVSSGGGQGDGESLGASISDDGRYVAFHSFAANLVTGDTNGRADVFLRDTTAGTTTRLSVSATGVQGDGESLFPGVSGSGGHVAFESGAANLVPGDTITSDIFIVSLAGGAPAAPTNLQAAALSSSRARLTWSDNSTNEAGFSIERRGGGEAEFQVIATTAAGVTAYQDATVARTSTYTYRLRALGVDGSSGYSGEAGCQIPSFDDVLPSSGQWAYVEAMRREGITAGCRQTPPLYCPNSAVTRGQMAVFLCRAAGWSPYDKPTPSFADVAKTNPQYGYIEEVYRRGVTAGCGGTPVKYCPDSPVTRGQMAVFLCRAAGVPTQNPATPTFTDVPATSGQYTYVEGMFTAGITAGCVTTPPRRYCPSDAVTRGQMAVFLCRAFGIGTGP